MPCDVLSRVDFSHFVPSVARVACISSETLTRIKLLLKMNDRMNPIFISESVLMGMFVSWEMVFDGYLMSMQYVKNCIVLEPFYLDKCLKWHT